MCRASSPYPGAEGARDGDLPRALKVVRIVAGPVSCVKASIKSTTLEPVLMCEVRMSVGGAGRRIRCKIAEARKVTSARAVPAADIAVTRCASAPAGGR